MDDELSVEIRAVDGGVGDGFVPEECQLVIEAVDQRGDAAPRVVIQGLEGVGSVHSRSGRTTVVLSVGSVVGWVPIVVEAPDRRLQTRLEVRPRKLDYERDFVTMREDIERIARGLLLHAWQIAAERLFARKLGSQTPAELIALLRDLWLELRRTFDLVARDPHRDFVPEQVVIDVSRARYVTQAGVADLVRQPTYWLPKDLVPASEVVVVTLPDGREVVPEKILDDRAELSADTPPNRVLKLRLSQLRRSLARAIAVAENAVPEGHFALNAQGPYLQLLDDVRGGLAPLAQADFVEEAGEARPNDRLDHVLEADARYRKAIQLFDVLQMALVTDVGGRPVEAPIRDLWEVYEYWVYLALVDEVLKHGWKIIGLERVFSVRPDGMTLALVRGSESKVRLARGEEKLEIIYQRSFVSRLSRTKGLKSRTHVMVPDIALLHRSATGQHLTVVDAKYRLDADRVSPPQQAVDALHVYRDGIGTSSGPGRFEPAVSLAIAAFPGPSLDEFKPDRYFQSLIDGIGAVPVLPSVGGATHLIDACGLAG